jgi:transposase InsO family protein
LLTDLIADIHKRSRGTYGRLRIRAALEIEHGLIVNKKLIARIMGELGIEGLPGQRRRVKNLKNITTADDLVQRNFTANGPNELWLTDITEHPTREGKCYCCVVLDLFSRKAVGWSIGRHCDADLVNAALSNAGASRTTTTATIIHSDHGSQSEFNWSSQHLDDRGVAWDDQGSKCRRHRLGHDANGPRTERCGRRCARQVVPNHRERCSVSSGV